MEDFKVNCLVIKPNGETMTYESVVTPETLLRETGDLTRAHFAALVNRWNKQSMAKETNVNRYFYTY